MKAKVLKDVCIGCTACASLCPKIFKMADDGKAEAYGEVTENLKDSVLEVETVCPVAAIVMEE